MSDLHVCGQAIVVLGGSNWQCLRPCVVNQQIILLEPRGQSPMTITNHKFKSRGRDVQTRAQLFPLRITSQTNPVQSNSSHL